MFLYLPQKPILLVIHMAHIDNVSRPLWAILNNSHAILSVPIFSDSQLRGWPCELLSFCWSAKGTVGIKAIIDDAVLRKAIPTCWLYRLGGCWELGECKWQTCYCCCLPRARDAMLVRAYCHDSRDINNWTLVVSVLLQTCWPMLKYWKAQSFIDPVWMVQNTPSMIVAANILSRMYHAIYLPIQIAPSTKGSI